MIAKLLRFIRASFSEVIYKVSWPSAKRLEKFFFLFLMGFLLCGICLFGINRLLELVQEIVYGWMYQTGLNNNNG